MDITRAIQIAVALADLILYASRPWALACVAILFI